MTCAGDKVSAAINSLVQRLNQEAEGGRTLSDKEQLVLRLNQQYPNDVGVLSAFFLNLVGQQHTTARTCTQHTARNTQHAMRDTQHAHSDLQSAWLADAAGDFMFCQCCWCLVQLVLCRQSCAPQQH